MDFDPLIQWVTETNTRFVVSMIVIALVIGTVFGGLSSILH